MTRKTALLAGLMLMAFAAPAFAQTQKPRNVIIFVADGLRYGIVNADTAPTFQAVREQGVDFRNSHALYPTVTTVNASAIATGHGIGDTGEFANNMHFDPGLKVNSGAPAADMEDDPTLFEVNGRYNNNYFNEMSLLHLARDNGYQTAAIGKEGPVLLQDIAAMNGQSTIIIDDATSARKKNNFGVPVGDDVMQAIKDAGLDTSAPDRGLNGSPGAYNMPGVQVANIYQQDWFRDVTTKVVLPRFAASGKPFALVYWSRDPDGTQHNTGDSLNETYPGINGPTSLAAVRNASDNLHALIDELKTLGLYDNTDIFVTADHGFSTISRQSKTSWSAKFNYPDDTVKGFLPSGFVAIDLAHALNMPLSDSYGAPLDVKKGQHPAGSAFLGSDTAHPDVLVVSAGGSDILYLDPAKAKDLAPKIVAALSHEDYVGGLFVSDDLGNVAGALPMSAARLIGTSLTPRPAIYVAFSDHADATCVVKWQNPELCSALIADGGLQQGQGQHGSFTRANTHNFMAAMGPDFKAGFADPSPISNADITPTLAHVLGFDLPSIGKLNGRVIAEALASGPASVDSTAGVVRSDKTADGFVTVLESQSVGDETYLDAAGMPGRVIGLKSKP